jgi:hypothetical protein
MRARTDHARCAVARRSIAYPDPSLAHGWCLNHSADGPSILKHCDERSEQRQACHKALGTVDRIDHPAYAVRNAPALLLADEDRGGLIRSDRIRQFLSGIAEAIKLPILSLAAWRSMLHPVSDRPAWNEADSGYTSSGSCRLSGGRG